MRDIDFKAANRTAMMHIDGYLDTHLPGGKRQGHEYVVRNPTRPDNSPGSFKINTTTGAWSDFATGDAGGDLISLHAYVADVTQLEAAKYLVAEYGGPAAKSERSNSKRKRTKWTPVLPVPDDAPEPVLAHYMFGPYAKRWAYRDRIGRVNGYACRFDRTNSKGVRVKEVLPLTYCIGDDGRKDWQFRSIPEPHPLYALDRLTEHPGLPVLVVEGEKCADAAHGVIGDRYVVTTHMGGSNAVHKADWTVLSGRTVILWPDNDAPGMKVLAALGKLLGGFAGELLRIAVPASAPEKWDIADAIEDGWERGRIEALLAKAIPVDGDAPPHVNVPVAGGDAGRVPGSSVPPALSPENYHHTDMGSAQLLVDRYGDVLRYNARPFGRWFWYDDIRWREDQSNRVYDYVDRVVRDILEEARQIVDGDKRKPLIKWAWQLESMSRQKAMVAKAETLQAVSVAVNEFDRNGWRFNCLNVTIDLESGEPEVYPHRAGDYITKLAPVIYEPDAECPKWDKFLRRIFMENDETIQFMQRAIGYSLTADVSEQVMFFSYGTGANGKSVFFETIRSLMGEYGGKIPTEMLMQQNFAQHPTDIADLRGKRFVVASEVEDGCRWAESRLKDLTGGDSIKARRMREDSFEFQQTHKLWLFGNHHPILRGVDEGIKRRMRIIPFDVKIPDEEKVPFRQMMAALRKELPGILNWALAGHVRWREVGLGWPEAIRDATRNYFSDNDILQQFIDECCVTGPNYSAKGKPLWEKYHGWCDSNGIRSLSSKGFYRVLQERGFVKRVGHGNKTVIDGIDLQDEPE